MRILVFGGTGFVGLNIAAALLARSHAVTLFDRAGLPPAAGHILADGAGRLTIVQGDITNRQAVEDVIAGGCEAIILGAAVTAGPEREAADPEAILGINLLAQLPILIAARRHGIGRIINLSSAAAYGASAFRNLPLDEATACDPVSLYAITKFASEKVASRLADLWQSDFVSVRLSAVFGPWERATGVRDTLSPQAQMIWAMQRGREAILPRPGVRDWIYAPDVADAVTLLIETETLKHRLYNVSTGVEWSALQWGEALTALNSSFACRLAQVGEVPTVDLHSATDRAPLSVSRLAQEFGWRARFGCADSAADYLSWWMRHGRGNLT
jgi:UDP-glucose 4-epimerase